MHLPIRLSHKLFVLVAVLLIFELVLLGTLSYALARAEAAEAHAIHGKAVIAQANNVLALVYKTAALLLIFSTTVKSKYGPGDPTSGAALDLMIGKFKPEFRKLREVVGNDSAQQRRLDELEPDLNKSMDLVTRYRQLVLRPYEFGSIKKIADVSDTITTIHRLMKRIQVLVDNQEDASSTDPYKTRRARAAVKLCLAAGVVLNIVLALASAALITRGLTRRIERLSQNTLALASGQKLQAPEGGSDEIAALDRKFHEMAVELEKASRQREDVERLRKEFIAMVSHDLRSPLTTVQSCLELIQDGRFGEISDRGQEFIADTEEEVDRLMLLVNSLLDVAVMEGGKLELKMEDCDVPELFKRSSTAVQGLARKNRIKIVNNLEEAEGEQIVFADRSRLVQVLVNLLANALKFSPPQSIVLLQLVESQDTAEIRVCDRGSGIPADQKKQIFERFEKASNNAQVQEGSGLGLTISKSIIEAHGGEIGVSDNEGGGSIFWFRLSKRPVRTASAIKDVD